GAALVAIQSLTVAAMLFPGTLAVLLSEAFAIRSWMFHAPVGGLSIFVGWTAMEEYRSQSAFYDDPKVVIAAGLAGGFAYGVLALGALIAGCDRCGDWWWTPDQSQSCKDRLPPPR